VEFPIKENMMGNTTLYFLDCTTPLPLQLLRKYLELDVSWIAILRFDDEANYRTLRRKKKK
jgi:hypothetical protein